MPILRRHVTDDLGELPPTLVAGRADCCDLLPHVRSLVCWWADAAHVADRPHGVVVAPARLALLAPSCLVRSRMDGNRPHLAMRAFSYRDTPADKRVAEGRNDDRHGGDHPEQQQQIDTLIVGTRCGELRQQRRGTPIRRLPSQLRGGSSERHVLLCATRREARLSPLECTPRVPPDDTVCRQTSLGLEPYDGSLGPWSEDAIHRPRLLVGRPEAALNGAHLIRAATSPIALAAPYRLGPLAP